MSMDKWQKSSYCQTGEACLHIAATATNSVHLTESADPARTILSATPTAFGALLRALKQDSSA